MSADIVRTLAAGDTLTVDAACKVSFWDDHIAGGIFHAVLVVVAATMCAATARLEYRRAVEDVVRQMETATK